MGKGLYGAYAIHYPKAEADKEGGTGNPGSVALDGQDAHLGAAPMADNQPGDRPVKGMDQVASDTKKHALK